MYFSKHIFKHHSIFFFPEKGIYNLIVYVLILPFWVKGQVTYYTMGTNKHHTARVDRLLHRKRSERDQHECRAREQKPQLVCRPCLCKNRWWRDLPFQRYTLQRAFGFSQLRSSSVTIYLSIFISGSIIAIVYSA